MKALLRLLILTTALSLAACGDDSSSSNNSANNGDNNTNNSTNNANNGNNTNNPTNNVNNANNVDDMGVEDMGEPDMGGTDDMGADTGGDDMGEVDMSMGPTPVDIMWPSTADDFASTANANTYISKLITPELDENDIPTCCKDFGDISKNAGTDNALAELDASISGFGASLAGSLQNGIEEGNVIILLDHRELESADDPDGFVLGWLNASFDGATTYQTAAAGQGQFLIDPASFIAGTGEPQIKFNPANMMQGNLTAGPTDVSLLLPLDSALLAVTVQKAEITGVATLSMDGVSYTAGTIAGYIALQNLFDALNELAAASCGCLGLGNTPLYENDGLGWDGNCVSNVGNLCPGADQEICRVIGGSNALNGNFCGVLPSIFENSADIDTDGNPDTYEALSLGLEWIGVNAEVTGILN